MSCERWEGKLGDYVAGRSSARDQEDVARHLETCASCRELAGEVESLYRLENGALGFSDSSVEPADAPSSWSDLAGEKTRRPVTPVVRTLALAALILVALVLFWMRDDLIPSSREASTPSATYAVKLEGCEVQLPDFPHEYPAPDASPLWFDRPEEAARYVAYTGRPVVEKYYFEQCPYCQELASVMEKDEVRERLDGFTFLATPIAQQIPDWIEQSEEKRPDDQYGLYLIPALRVWDARDSTAAHSRVVSPERIDQVIADWRTVRPEPRGIDRAEYAQLVAGLEEIPALAREGRYATALTRLDLLAVQNADRSPAFADHITALRRQVEAGLERAVERLEETRSRGEALPPAEEPIAAKEVADLIATYEELAAVKRLEQLIGSGPRRR